MVLQLSPSEKAYLVSNSQYIHLVHLTLNLKLCLGGRDLIRICFPLSLSTGLVIYARQSLLLPPLLRFTFGKLFHVAALSSSFSLSSAIMYEGRKEGREQGRGRGENHSAMQGRKEERNSEDAMLWRKQQSHEGK